LESILVEKPTVPSVPETASAQTILPAQREGVCAEKAEVSSKDLRICEDLRLRMDIAEYRKLLSQLQSMPPKHVRKIWVAPNAKEQLANLGPGIARELLELNQLPVNLTKFQRELDRQIVRDRMEPRNIIPHRTRQQRTRYTVYDPSVVAMHYAELKGMTVGEKRKVREGTVTLTDSKAVDGNLKQVYAVKFELPSRSVNRKGEVTYIQEQKETIVHFEDELDLPRRRARTTFRRDTAPPWAWKVFLRQTVRFNPDTIRCKVGNREFELDKYRVQTPAITTLLTRKDILKATNKFGELTEPYLSNIAARLSAIQWGRQTDFDTVIQEHLPTFMAHTDFFGEEDDYILRPLATPAKPASITKTVLTA
jgi:hypothetical protein